MSFLRNISAKSHDPLSPILLEQSIEPLSQGPSLFHRYLQILKTDQTLTSDLTGQIHPPEVLYDKNKKLKEYKTAILTPKDPLFSRIHQVIALLQTAIFSSPQSEQAAQKIQELYQSYINQVCNNIGKKRMSLLKGPAYLLGIDQEFLLLDRKIALELTSLDTYGQSAKLNGVKKVGEVYFKRFARMNLLYPGREFAIDFFNHILMEEGSPAQLIKIEGIWVQSVLDASEPKQLKKLNVRAAMSRSQLACLSNASDTKIEQVTSSLSPPVQNPLVKLFQYNRALENQQRLDREIAIRTSSKEFFIKHPELKKDYPFKEKRISQIVQVSHLIQGINLSEFLDHTNNLSLIDSYHFSAMVLLGICISPSNGKSDNYTAVSQSDHTFKYVGIGNTLAFTPHFLKRKDKHFLNLRYVFFLFPQMHHSLDPLLRTKLEKMEMEFFLLEWLVALEKKNAFYQKLLENGMLNHREFEELGLPISLSSTSLHNIYQTLIQAKAFIKTHPTCTNFELLHHLSPHVALIYQKLITDSNGDIIIAQRKLFDHRIHPIAWETFFGEHPPLPPPIELGETTPQQPIKLLLDWVASLEFVLPQAQERLLDKLFLELPNLKTFKLSHCVLEDHVFVNTFSRLKELQELKIEKFPQLTTAGLFSLLQQHPGLHLILGEEHRLNPQEMAEVIQYAWNKDRKISFQLGSDIFPITKETLDGTLIKMLEKTRLFSAEVLCILGADLQQQDEQGNTLLHLFAEQEPATLAFLLGQRLSPLKKNHKEQTPLHVAIQGSYLENIEVLIKAAARLEDKDLNGKTALHLAIIQGQVKAASRLIELGADPRARASKQETCLHLAAFYNHLSLVSLLIDLAPDLLNVEDNDGNTPLHCAVWGDPKPKVVELLLQKKASPDSKSKYGYTPLHWAIQRGHLESIQLLVDYRANCMLSTQNGDDLLDLAIKYEQHEVFRYFLLLDLPSSDVKAHSLKPLRASFFSSFSQDIQENLYLHFVNAYEADAPLEQLLCLEKMAAHHAHNDVMQAAHLLNAALVLHQKYAFSALYRYHLFSKLERLEKLFLEKLGITPPADHQESIRYDRHQLTFFREEVHIQIEEQVAADKVLETLTQSYQQLLEELINSSISLLSQKPPCAFAVIGLGSIARHEMCPYSNLGFAILIEKSTSKTRNYFTTLSRFLELRITNMGETQWPLLPLKRQPDGMGPEALSLISKGFSIDEGLSPLGKPGVYELIGTPKALAAYQAPLWLKKNKKEEIVVNALTQVSWIMGKEELVELYETEIKDLLYPRFLAFKIKTQIGEKRALQLLQKQTQEFKPHLTNGKVNIQTLDIKKDFYTPLQVTIESLLLYYGYKGQGLMAGITTLETEKVISSTEAARLKQAVNHILTLRARVHLFYKQEQEILFHSKGDEHVSNKGLYVITSEELTMILKIYRVLIPLHKTIQAFLQDPTSSVLKTATFYDVDIETIANYEDRLLCYEEALIEVESLEEDLLYKKQVLECKKKTLDEKDPALLEILNNVGETLGKLGRHEEALFYQKQALELCRRIFDRERVMVMGTILKNIGYTLRELGQYEEVLIYHELALKLCSKIYGKEHSVVIRIQNNIGFILSELRSHEEALIYLKQVLKLNRKTLNEKHPDLVLNFNNVGVVLSELGNHKEALTYHKQALELAREIFDPEHPLVVQSLSKMGSTLIILEKYEEALEYKEQELKLMKECLGGKPHSDIASLLNVLGFIYVSTKNYRQALSSYEESHAIAIAVHGNIPHPNIGFAVNGIGAVWQAQGDLSKAIDFRMRAYQIFVATLGPDDSSTQFVKEKLKSLGIEI